LRLTAIDAVVCLGGLAQGKGIADGHVQDAGEEASRFLPLDQLALSGQCGFSSTVEGNALTRDQQIATLAPIVETAEEVWG
jgi:hypothetical protein